MDKVVVAKFDGTMACGSGTQRPLSEDETQLRSLGAGEVYGSTNVPGPFGTCRACHICPSGQVNAFLISADDWEKIQRGIVGTLGFMLWEGAPYPDFGAADQVRTLSSRPAGAGLSVSAMPVLLRDVIGYTIRVLGPDGVGTTDYQPDRVTFYASEEGRIIDIQIG